VKQCARKGLRALPQIKTLNKQPRLERRNNTKSIDKGVVSCYNIWYKNKKIINPLHDPTRIIMVDQKKFDELVENTTKYLTDLMKRVASLESEVKELKVAKKPTSARKENASE